MSDAEQEFWNTLTDGLNELFPRLERLEQRCGLTTPYFGCSLDELSAQERTDATMAMVRWRVERLETFQWLQ